MTITWSASALILAFGMCSFGAVRELTRLSTDMAFLRNQARTDGELILARTHPSRFTE